MKTVRLFHIVLLVSLVLLGLKLGDLVLGRSIAGSGQAMAQEKPKEEQVASAEAKNVGEGEKTVKPAHRPGKVSDQRPVEFMSTSKADLPSKSEIEVLKSLRDRRKVLDKREEALRLRENLLRAAEKRLEKRVGELKEIESNIEKTHQQNEEKSKKGLKNLVSMYSNMKPKEAARIFNSLDMEVLISLVDQMNARKMAPVLAKMKPAVAKALTIEIAERLNKKSAKVRESDPLPSIPEK